MSLSSSKKTKSDKQTEKSRQYTKKTKIKNQEEKLSKRRFQKIDKA